MVFNLTKLYIGSVNHRASHIICPITKDLKLIQKAPPKQTVARAPV